MSFFHSAGVMLGRVLRRGVRDDWGAFRRGAFIAGTGMIAASISLGVVAWHWDDLPQWNTPLPVLLGNGTHRVPGRLDRAHQCYIKGYAKQAKSTTFSLLVDSGAYILSFSRDHVRELGIDPSQLDYNLRTMTANGEGRAARIILAELRLGGAVLRNVLADVDYEGAGSPLLGTSILQNFKFELSGKTCALIW